MDKLPAHIADMCGLVMNKPEITSQDIQEKYDNPIKWTENGDGTFTLTYFGNVVGWANTTKLDKRDSNTYRAVSTHGNVRMCWSKDMAKAWLLEQYH